MVLFHALYVSRSDGKSFLTTARGRETNEPLPEQLDQKPNTQGICDYYRLCEGGDVKEVDWRRKLGGMLMKELGSKEPKDRNYILASLPENYRLFEHVKCKLKDGEPETSKTTKTHAAGGNERQDAYLYGHPLGRKKRYRSPAEFFPHLLWLATDETGDSDNCACKFCSPEELESDIQSKIAAKQAKTEAKTKVAEQPKAAPITPIQPHQPQPPQPPRALVATPLLPFKSPEHKDDAMFGKFLYRTGEVAWFSRGTAWGLGVIYRRELLGGQQSYRIQPLSHPFHHPAAVVTRADQLRPWLAWSPPPCTHEALNTSDANIREIAYDYIDWQAVTQGQYGRGDAEVDGSILAARRAEATFTLFEPIVQPAPAGEFKYYGIFIGGEKIWVGDALRVRNFGPQTEVLILVLHEIIERPNPKDPERPTIILVGDKYSYKVAQLERPPPSSPADDLNLPSRVREDLDRRNRITFSSTNPALKFTSFWKLVGTGERLGIRDIKGRWWETSLLFPVLDGAEFERQKQAGESKDVTLIMNGQGDCNRSPGAQPGTPGGFRPAEIKCRRREEAFGKAVPRELRVAYNAGDARRADSSAPGSGSALGQIDPSLTQAMPNIGQRADFSGANSQQYVGNHSISGRTQQPTYSQSQPQTALQPPQQQQRTHANRPQHGVPGQTFGTGVGTPQSGSNSAFEQFMNFDGQKRTG